MDQASQQDAAGACQVFSFDRLLQEQEVPLPAQSIHFAVPIGKTLTWRVAADSTLRVHGSRVWITRARSPYDHWLNPGGTLRVLRGERLWISCDDPADFADLADFSPNPARVTITSAWRPPLASARQIAERVGALLALLTMRRAPR
ncbi:DUF2917 domain-containing protein [Paraburkholderia sp. Ac-20340]|uniref:DUF2917 domain-containing protein n=1 Tax=Paraburkholderia sp. Ac-20340 TaxID=2703888 RepID=UPI00197DD2D4|nr:DUF2917 domain-containing protein [Paraburkholderia sp. Ac-20340]MBN3855643.1 DUF2917 domain-containing protein [Paraburkholderia sp. Ac-20340]